MKYKLTVITYLIALIMSFICIRIEILNRESGYRLPNREFYNDNQDNGPVKWRESPITTEKRWRQVRGPRNEDGSPAERELTSSEKYHMECEISGAKANNALLEFVSSAGLLQYILVPLTFFLSFALYTRLPVQKRRILIAFPPMFLAILCGILMLYRGYFTSLGW